MATYLQGGVDFLPQETLFTPNWSLIQQGLVTKQGAYDKGFAQISNAARNIIDAPLTNKYTKGMRKQILADAEQALKDLPNMDLTLPQNVGAATSLFKPFYQNDSILYDMMETKRYMSERQRGIGLATSAKEEDRNRYWSEGIQDLDDWAEEFSNLDVKDLTKAPARRYVSKPNIDDNILKLFSEGKLKTSYDTLSGQWKFTDENGKALEIPITNLYLAMAENDPEAMAGYQVIGRVRRNRFIRENEQRLGSREAAAQAHDNALANDYFNTQKAIYDQTNDALTALQATYDAYKTKVDANQIVAGSPEYNKAVETVKKYNQLKARRDKLAGDIFSVAGKPPAYLERITGNPTAYLANVYLNKSAIDLATALSQFGGRKVDINPVWEKLDLAVHLKDVELQKQKQLETFKTDEMLRGEEGKIKLKILYGIPLSDGTSTSGSNGASVTNKSIGTGNINVPFVEEAPSGAAAFPKDEQDNVDSHGLFQDLIKSVSSQVLVGKRQFIETVLKPEEIKTIDGVLIPPDKRGDMMNMKISSKLLSAPQGPVSVGLPKLDLSSGKQWRGSSVLGATTPGSQGVQAPTLQSTKSKYDNEFDRLYDLAMEKWKAWGETGVNTNEYNSARELLKKVSIQDKAWTAANEWHKLKMSEVIGNLSGSQPDIAYKYKALFDGNDIVSNVDEYISNLAEVVPKSYTDDIKKTATAELRKLTDRAVRDRDQPGDAERIKNLSRLVNLSDKQLFTEFAAQNKSKLTDEYNNLKKMTIGTWNKAGNEFNYFSTFNQKGGGLYARQLSFALDNAVMGEKGDQYLESLLSTISSYDNNGDYSNAKVQIKFGDGASLGNSSSAETLFGKLKGEILNTIRLGKGKEGQTIPKMMFRSRQIAGNNKDWAAYTLYGIDNEWIDKNTGTSQKPGLLTNDEATNLRSGITIFVKKDIDKSLAALNSNVGEVEMLLSAGNGIFKDEIAPNYGIEISRLSTGEYKIATTFQENKNVQGMITESPITKTQIVDQNTDITELYYETLRNLDAAMLQNQDIKRRLESSRTANPAVPKATWSDINNAAKQ